MGGSTFVCSTFAALALLFRLGLYAWAGDVVYHGSLCNPAESRQIITSGPGGSLADQIDIDVIWVGYTQFGVHNGNALRSVVVSCGAAPSFSSTITTVLVTVYDRHPGSDVICDLILTNMDGATLWTDKRSSAGSSLSSQTLMFNPNSATHTINLHCAIPPVAGGRTNAVVFPRDHLSCDNAIAR